MVSRGILTPRIWSLNPSVQLKLLNSYPTSGQYFSPLYVNAQQRQNPLKNSCDADQHHQQLEQLRQPTINGKPVYAQKQIAPMTTIIKTPIKAESIVPPVVANDCDESIAQ